jgi:hypothetical protein
MSAVSPRKFGVGIVQNFIPLDAPESNVRSSRNAIKGELVHKLVYDDARVFDRYLGIDQVSTPLVDYCVAGFNAANEQAIEQLRKITDDAAPKPLDELEAPERDGEGVQRKAKREEKKMYPHLVFPSSFPITRTSPYQPLS